jgi:hypothetical protein
MNIIPREEVLNVPCDVALDQRSPSFLQLICRLLCRPVGGISELGLIWQVQVAARAGLKGVKGIKSGVRDCGQIRCCGRADVQKIMQYPANG